MPTTEPLEAMLPVSARQRWGLAVFLLLAFGSAWGIELGPVRWLTKGKPLMEISDPLAAAGVQGLLALVMWMPGLAALVARLVERGGFADAGLRWGRGRYYLVAWLLPVAIAVVAAVLTVLLGQAQFDLSMTAMWEKQQRLSPHQPIPEFFRSPLFLWLLMPAINLTLGVAITSLFAFGEEFGWRGYLQLRLMHFGALKAMALTGVVWGLWHAPIILQGHNYPKHPEWGVPLMVLFCVMWAFLFGWLRLASGSVFPCAIAHASLNVPGGSTLAYLKDYDTAIGTVVGIIGMAVAGAVVAWLGRTGRLREQKANHTA